MPAKSPKAVTVSETSEIARRFEITKRKNFSHSSRLEGITQPEERLASSLENVLSKYKVNR